MEENVNSIEETKVIPDGSYNLDDLDTYNKEHKDQRILNLRLSTLFAINTMIFGQLVKESPFVTNKEIAKLANLKCPLNTDEIIIFRYGIYDKVYISVDLLRSNDILHIYTLISNMKAYSNVVNLKHVDNAIVKRLLDIKLIAPTNINDVFIVNHHEVFVGDDINVFNCIYYYLYGQRCVEYNEEGNIILHNGYEEEIPFIDRKYFKINVKDDKIVDITYDKSKVYNNIVIPLDIIKIITINKR